MTARGAVPVSPAGPLGDGHPIGGTVRRAREVATPRRKPVLDGFAARK
ncbi:MULTISPECIES: hypothetical protein [unclassified Streptomyces]